MFWRLKRIEAKLDTLIAQGRTLMATLADIQAKVTAESTVEDSVIALLNGISQQLKDALAANDPKALQAVSDGLDANIAKLTAAVTANTPAAPTP